MLHYCSVDDIKAVYPAAGRFDDAYARAREAVTNKFNDFVRRDLTFETGVTEYFDSQRNIAYQTQKLWLLKKAIDPDSLQVFYSWRQEWTAEDAQVLAESIRLDATKGTLFLSNPMIPGTNAIKVVYDGGYKPVQVNNSDTDVMDCPGALRTAAIDQAAFELRRTLTQGQGEAQDSKNVRQRPINQKALIDGLLPDVFAVLKHYRKPLGDLM